MCAYRLNLGMKKLVTWSLNQFSPDHFVWVGLQETSKGQFENAVNPAEHKEQFACFVKARQTGLNPVPGQNIFTVFPLLIRHVDKLYHALLGMKITISNIITVSSSKKKITTTNAT